MSSVPDEVRRVLTYHERTKHHPQRYARALGYLDWETQPDPFRTYAGAPRVELPLAADGVETSYGDLYTDAVEPRPLGLASVAAFLELSLGITAWKEYEGARWALRANPSSGNLHPTEGYVVSAGAPDLAAGVYHYVSRDHDLERRCALAPPVARELERALPVGAFLVGLSSVHWREAWKYGERAFRYCQHDAGHAIGGVRYAAAALGWRARLLDGLGDASVAALLGLDRDADWAALDRLDREHPDVVLLVTPSEPAQGWEELERTVGELVPRVAASAWAGVPNALSSAHHAWDVIDDVADATRKPASRAPAPARVADPDPAPALVAPRCATPAATILRQRRSAVAFDGVTSITAPEFYALLDRVHPRPGVTPWDALPWAPRIHLGLFVHRVDGLAPGVYVLERTRAVHEPLVAMLGANALWARPPGCPAHLRLFGIGEVDCRRTAAAVSCGQDIAGDGAFSLGMFAELRAAVEAGPFRYRRLFWETGVLGQALYLEAEALGVRATGIGCYFDDAVHDVLGLEGDRFQSLYHFTVGGPVEDTRLATYPPYEHLAGRAATPRVSPARFG